jgi:deoxyribose-phosphate aldolase
MLNDLQSIAKMIDHSLLHPTLTDADLINGCQLAASLHVAAVCIKPYAVPLAANILVGSDVLVGSVIGFPHGNSHIDIKKIEAERAITDGASEIDMVVNIGKVLSQDWEYISLEIKEINDLVVGKKAILKVIFENDYLNDDSSKVKLCQICLQHNVAYVKTSTGYGFVKRTDGLYNYAGATDYDLKLMCHACLPFVKVKAAGGIRTLDDLLRVQSYGVTRVGATATETILTEAKLRGFV